VHVSSKEVEVLSPTFDGVVVSFPQDDIKKIMVIR
tara:strand:+ start:46 stop:150 length:105 start_codon:yes stop_codon:yes gene_type:complete